MLVVYCNINDVLGQIHILARCWAHDFGDLTLAESSAEGYAGSAEAEMFQGFGPSYMSIAGVTRQRMAVVVDESWWLFLKSSSHEQWGFIDVK